MVTTRLHGRHRGFTLVELMITLTVAAILAAVAIPNMRTFLWNNRISSTANDLLHSIQVARTEAIKRQNGSVSVCATPDASSAVSDASLACSYGNFSQWFVFYDQNSNGVHDNGEPVLGRGGAAPTNTVKSNQKGIVCFGPTGFSNPVCGTQQPTTAVTICDTRGNTAVGTNSTARALFISQTGRARVSQLFADVNTAIASTGSCP